MERNLLVENSDKCVISEGIMTDDVEPLHLMKKGLMRNPESWAVVLIFGYQQLFQSYIMVCHFDKFGCCEMP